MGKNVARFTKNGWYGMNADTFTKIAKREENEAMATFKTKKYRLEAIETAYEAVELEASRLLKVWNWETHEETTRTIEELEEDEQAKYKAYTDFLKELDKLA